MRPIRARPVLALLAVIGLACEQTLVIADDGDDRGEGPRGGTKGEGPSSSSGGPEEEGGEPLPDGGLPPRPITCDGLTCGDGEKCCFDRGELGCRPCNPALPSFDIQLDCQGPRQCPDGQQCCVGIGLKDVGYAYCKSSCGAQPVLCDATTKDGCPMGDCVPVECSGRRGPIHACKSSLKGNDIKGCKL